jgi:hypothetical protein
MKKLIGIALITCCLGITSATYAQDDTSKVTKKVKKAARKTADKTAEVASKGKAVVTDQVHKDKVGPGGETIYIDNHSKYYWIDKKGTRHYVLESELKAKEN